MNPTYNIASELRTLPFCGLYIHVPFCHARCAYCDFYSQTSCHDTDQIRYCAAVKSSLDALAETEVPISTLYFGGGTPSALGPRLPDLVRYAKENVPVQPDAEITVEVNPESFDENLLEELVASGVNRISVGVQALDDRVLSLLSRLHTKADALRTLELLKKAGINYSVDLIAAIPSTTPEDMRAWIDEVALYNPFHISLYPLSVEPRSALASHPLFQNIDEDFAADCLEQAWTDIEHHGFVHYEISNFAREGFESKHNTSYWEGASYIGIGPSASSSINRLDSSRLRFTLTDSLEEFCTLPALIMGKQDDTEELSATDALREDIMLAMRLKSGVSLERVEAAGLIEVFQALRGDGMCIFDKLSSRFIPTRRGWMLGNEMFGAIWCAEL